MLMGPSDSRQRRRQRRRHPRIEMTHGQETQKYSGKNLWRFEHGGNGRCETYISHSVDKIQSTQGNTCQSRHASMKLRLTFFISIISPAMLFCLTTVPLSATHLSKPDIVRGKMLRSMVGCVPVANGDGMMRCQTSTKKPHAYRIHPTKSWPEMILGGKFGFAARIHVKTTVGQLFVRDGNP